MEAHAEFPDELPADWTPAIKRIKLILFGDIRDNFQGSHAPDGTPWKPLANKRPRGGTGKPLMDKGLLRASMTVEGATGHVDEMGPLYLEAGSDLEYAWIQQEGGIVRPKQAKLLAVPLSREAVNFPRPRSFPRKLFVLKSKRGRFFLAESAGGGKRRQKLVLHYILLPFAEIAARPFAGFSPAFLERMDEALADYAEEWLLS